MFTSFPTCDWVPSHTKNFADRFLNLCSIGGNPRFICEALSNELEAREIEDAEHRYAQSWHVVVVPDSNMSSTPRYHLYRGSQVTEHYPAAVGSRQQTPLNSRPGLLPPQRIRNNQQAMPFQPNPQNGQQRVFFRQNPYNRRQALVSQGNVQPNQQAMLPQNNAMGGYGQRGPSVPPSQQWRLTTPMTGTFGGGGGPPMAFPRDQLYSQASQQQKGSFGGFSTVSGPAQGNFGGFVTNHGAAQGNFGGLASSTPAQGSYRGQSNNMMFDQSGAPTTAFLPQIRRPIFDKQGYIVGEEADLNPGNVYNGGNTYGSNMYSNNNMAVHPQPMPLQVPQQQGNPIQQARGSEMRDQDTAALAQDFYSFVQAETKDFEEQREKSGREKRMKYEAGRDEDDGEENIQDDFDQDEGDREEIPQDEAVQDERVQDEGVALGNASDYDNGNNAASTGSQLAPPPEPAAFPSPPVGRDVEPLAASEMEPHRFTDNTGTNLCDYCGRDGHEADACIRWDPVHFDKPVCTACNNDQHSLDECPKFRGMSVPERRALLLGKGARRPGVRSEDHAWTRYVRLGGTYANEGGGGMPPLTRVFLRGLSRDEAMGPMMQNMWRVWDYRRGVPNQFRDLGADGLAEDQAQPLDERFMGGEHEVGRKVPVAQNQGRCQASQQARPEVGHGEEEGGNEEEL